MSDRTLLPPMGAIHAFIEAAATENFSAAGARLGLSQSAISRQIAVIEAMAGKQPECASEPLLAMTAFGRDAALQNRFIEPVLALRVRIQTQTETGRGGQGNDSTHANSVRRRRLRYASDCGAGGPSVELTFTG